MSIQYSTWPNIEGVRMLSRPKAGFYTGPALYCPSARMYVISTKLRVCNAKMNTVPLSFIKNHKYHSNRMREGHAVIRRHALKMILKKVRLLLKISNIAEIERRCEVQVDRKHDNNLFQASLRPK